MTSLYRVVLAPQAQRQLAALPPRRRASLEARLVRRMEELAAYAGARQWVAPEELEDGFRAALPGQPGILAHYALDHVARTLTVYGLDGVEG